MTEEQGKLLKFWRSETQLVFMDSQIQNGGEADWKDIENIFAKILEAQKAQLEEQYQAFISSILEDVNRINNTLKSLTNSNEEN